MAVKSKTALGRIEHRPGQHSKASHGRKKYRGQGS